MMLIVFISSNYSDCRTIFYNVHIFKKIQHCFPTQRRFTSSSTFHPHPTHQASPLFQTSSINTILCHENLIFIKDTNILKYIYFITPRGMLEHIQVHQIKIIFIILSLFMFFLFFLIFLVKGIKIIF